MMGEGALAVRSLGLLSRSIPRPPVLLKAPRLWVGLITAKGAVVLEPTHSWWASAGLLVKIPACPFLEIAPR